MPITGEQLAFFYFVIILPAALWVPVIWLLLSIFTPKKLLDRYFKEPHFTLTETILLAQFPGFLIRTGIFGWAVLVPKMGKKRQIEDVREHMPRWYRVGLELFLISISFVLATAVIVTPILVFFDF